MVRFSSATKISPQWGSKIAVIFQFLFHQVDFNFKRNPPNFPLDLQVIVPVPGMSDFLPQISGV